MIFIKFSFLIFFFFHWKIKCLHIPCTLLSSSCLELQQEQDVLYLCGLISEWCSVEGEQIVVCLCNLVKLASKCTRRWSVGWSALKQEEQTDWNQRCSNIPENTKFKHWTLICLSMGKLCNDVLAFSQTAPCRVRVTVRGCGFSFIYISFLFFSERISKIKPLVAFFCFLPGPVQLCVCEHIKMGTIGNMKTAAHPHPNQCYSHKCFIWTSLLAHVVWACTRVQDEVLVQDEN